MNQSTPRQDDLAADHVTADGGGDSERRVRELRKSFVDDARSLLDLAESKLSELQNAVGEFASLKAENCWAKEKFERRCDDLRQRVRSLRDRLHLRPTLCVAGRRGAGKSTLLQTWLGEKVLGGIPVGNEDTTSCLMRLTRAESPTEDLLEVHLFSRGEVEKAAGQRDDFPSAALPVLRVRMQASNEDVRALEICGFPNDKTRGCYLVESADNRGTFELKRNPQGKITISLEQAQWFAKEVIVPIPPSGDWSSAAARLLEVGDLVDSPGADVAHQQDRWRSVKNNLVFEHATDQERLDVLLITQSCKPAGSNMGGQFQDKIMGPWERRCRDNPRNRLLAVLTSSADLLFNAWKIVQGTAVQGERIEFFSNLKKNLISQLRGGDSEEARLVRVEDLSTWPYFFFVEKVREPLKDFQEGIEPGQGQVVAERLWKILESDDATADERLPLGQKCILWMAETCKNAEFVNPEQVKALQRWVIEGMCALLDDADRGYRRLTDFVVEYLGRGPVATSHLDERLEECSNIVEGLEQLIREMADPQASQVRDQLERLCQRIHNAMQSNPDLSRGPRLQLGKKSEALFKRVEAHGRLSVTEPRVQIDDVWRAVVEDAIDSAADWFQFKGVGQQAVPEGTGGPSSDNDRQHAVKILLACLQSDRSLKPLLRRLQNFYEKTTELSPHLVAALERLARIILYLGQASGDEKARQAVLQHCLEVTATSSELAPFLQKRGLNCLPPDLRERRKQVEESARQLRDELQKDIQPRPFEIATSGQPMSAAPGRTA